MVYFIYAFGVLAVIGFGVFLFTKNQKVALGISAIPAIISLLFFGWFAKVNFFSTGTCDASTGCRNETGMLLVFSLFFIFMSIVLFLLSLLINKFRIINK